MTSKLETLTQIEALLKQALTLANGVADDGFISQHITETLQGLVTGPGWTIADWQRAAERPDLSDIEIAFEAFEDAAGAGYHYIDTADGDAYAPGQIHGNI